MTLVVDASALAPLALVDEAAEYSNRVLLQIEKDGSAIVPPLFWNELLNVFAIAERRGRIESAITDRFLDEMTAAPLRTHTLGNWREPLRLARDYGLTVYDASYLATAMETSSSLATLDAALGRAAAAAGVALFLGDE